ncbi:MAG TPA: HAD family hydrolase, partial [Marmoricola sp.]|nr:HAD family hydrolase [Marmoricola sp.]
MLKPCASALIEQHDLIALDLDGVVYIGRNAVDHAVSALAAATGSGVRLAYLTNNAARP